MLLNEPRPARKSNKRKLLLPLVLLLTLTLLGGTLRFGEAQTQETQTPTNEPRMLKSEGGDNASSRAPLSDVRGSSNERTPAQLPDEPPEPMVAPEPKALDKDKEQTLNLCAAINNGALEFAKNKHYDVAITILDQGIALDPAYAPFKHNQVFVLYHWIRDLAQKGLFDDARKVYNEEAKRRVPNNEHLVKLVKSIDEHREVTRSTATLPALDVRASGMKPWSSYIIESPDILNVEAVNLVPKAPYKLRVFDVVYIDIIGAEHGDPILNPFVIEPGGMIQLGSEYGAVNIEGMSAEEAKEAVMKHLGPLPGRRIIGVKLSRMGDMQQIAGNHTVGPDGFITLGSYGRVSVSGLSVPECQKAIVTHLSQFLEKPNVTVTVFSYNSKEYYVIVKGAEVDMLDTFHTFPCTGNDTVMKAVANLGSQEMPIMRCTIKHIRPGDDDKPPVVRVLDWEKILSSRSGFGDNLQLLPGDRIVLEMKAQ
jgi:hypothetical protein